MLGRAMKLRGRRWIWGAALLLPAAILLLWAVSAPRPAPEETGVVKIADARQPAAAPPAPPPSVARRAPPSPQRNSELADENQYLVTREARDRGWADRSEASLLAFMRGLAQVNARSLTAKCTTSVCEVSGLALEDPATESMEPIWQALDRDTASGKLPVQGLERDATTFGTGRVREAFMIYYRRLAPAG